MISNFIKSSKYLIELFFLQFYNATKLGIKPFKNTILSLTS